MNIGYIRVSTEEQNTMGQKNTFYRRVKEQL